MYLLLGLGFAVCTVQKKYNQAFPTIRIWKRLVDNLALYHFAALP
jgi:hypothetical protein